MAVTARITIPQEAIVGFCRRWKVREFSLFGSVLRDDFSEESDIDVLIELSDDARWSLFDWVKMIDELELLFGRDVDLVEKQGLRNPFRRREILATREVVYAA